MNHHKIYKKTKYYRHLTPIISLFLWSSIEAFATDWAPIKKTKDYELLVDMDSYNETAGLPFITAKTIFNSPKKYLNNGKNLLYIEALSISQFNCRLHTYKVLETHFYNPKNKLIGSQKGMKPFEILENGSDSASIASLVCQVHQMVDQQ